MKTTIVLMALAIAGFLEREGYSSFALVLAAFAVLEYFAHAWQTYRKSKKSFRRRPK